MKDCNCRAARTTYLTVMFRTAILILAASGSAPGDEAAPQRSEESGGDQIEFFERHIRPVLVEHCYACHSADAKSIKGSLLLDSREGMLTGGDSGPAIVVGKPDESLLMQALRHESLEMPPDKKLAGSIVDRFDEWIRHGAADPRKSTQNVSRSHRIDIEEGREFWSFRPVIRPHVPAAGDGWALDDIDRFIADAQIRLQHAAGENASASPATRHPTPPAFSRASDAPPAALIRRLTFVLTGLPPSVEEQELFLRAWQKDPDAAMADTVDRLLSSPRFGERWGRHWLDVARFAESTGGGRSMMLPDAWRYRDYVIRSFNQDKPFDQMIREQLAGDLLPFATDEQHDEQLTGVGYLMLGAINYEEQDKEQLRMDVVDEQIDSLGRSFLGMTLGCSRCHDHKFDPIPTTDYYALAGIFRSTKSLTPGNVCGFITAPLRMGYDKAALEAWTVRDREFEAQITALKSSLKGSSERGGAPAVSALPGVVVDDTEAELDGEWTFSRYQQPFIGDGYHHSGQPRTGLSARYETMLPEDGEYVVRMVINHADSRSAQVPVTIAHADGESEVLVSQKLRPPGDGVFAELGRFRFTSDRPARVVVQAAQASPGFVIVDAIHFLPAASVNSSSDRPLSGSISKPAEAEIRQQLKTLEDQRKTHAKEKPPIPTAMCVEEEKEPSDWHVHIRGEIRNLGSVVPRGFLTVATPPDAPYLLSQLTTATTSGRKELADWVASDDNPLTARVYVNRVWQNVFGEGLVRTPDNFGATGEHPSHPELLDYLAAVFVQDCRWSSKSFIRRLCLSRTFRMSSAVPTGNLIPDPENRSVLHAFRRRLDAESLRDSLLAISGTLDLSVGSGLTIMKLGTYDNEYRHAVYPTNARSVFVPSFRNTMLDLFEIFDAANPNLVTGRRTRSTRPAQALYLLNSPFVMEQASRAAKNFLQSSDHDRDDIKGSVRRAWQLCLSRRPTDAELNALLPVVADQPDTADAWAAVFHALFASVEFRYLD